MTTQRYAGPQRVIVTVGGLYRRCFRRRLMALGVRWQEDRGLLDSAFAVDVPDGQMLTLMLPEVS